MTHRQSIYITFFLFIILQIGNAQTPRIRWWFDTRDAAFGQTAAGDIDQDGKLELVFGCYRNDSMVYALNAEDGSLLWKYNTHAQGAEGCNDVAPLIYDVDNDGAMEVIVPSSCNPTTFCFDGKTGAVKWRTATRGSDSPPTIADIDLDGKPEILHGEFGGYVICLNAEDGSIAWEIAVDKRSWIQTAPTLVDLDGDSRLDFVVATWNRTAGDTNKVYAFRGSDHSLLWSRPLADVVYHGTAVADLDRDGRPELVVGDYSGTLTVMNGEDGSVAWTYRYATGHYIGAPAAIADLDHDGRCEIVICSWYKIIALRDDGQLFWEYSIDQYATAFRGVALSDVDDDRSPDVHFGTSGGRVVALKGTTGKLLWSIDLAAHVGNAAFAIDHAPVISDFNHDDTLDLFIVGGHGEYPNFQNDFGRAYALSIGKGGGPDWLMFQKNNRRNSSLCDAPIASIVEQKTKSSPRFTLYPNPVSSMLHIEGERILKIEIIDHLGRQVACAFPSENYAQISVDDFPIGFYLVKSTTLSGMIVRKFVKR